MRACHAVTTAALVMLMTACRADVVTAEGGKPGVQAATAPDFAVGLYSACSDRTEPAARSLLPSFSEGRESACVDMTDRVIGVEPDFVRVSSPDGFSGQLFVRCEQPAPVRWREATSQPSRLVLVAEGRVLSEFRTTGNPSFDRCGIFTAEDPATGVEICRQMLGAWKKDPLACERSCTDDEPLTRTCTER